MHLHSAMKPLDFDDEACIKKVYLKEVAEGLEKLLGASQIQIFEHVLRKRHEIFPISTGEPYKYNQPTSIAHIGGYTLKGQYVTELIVKTDTTPEWSMTMAEKLNPGRDFESPNAHFQCLNIWKPLKGPLRDWPLALCDIATVNMSDVQPGDLVHPNFVIENCQVHYNPEQRWYYISDQLESEAWVFLQSDSKYPWVKAGVPHSAFPHPLSSPEDLPRESIELRSLAWYDEEIMK